MMPAGMNLDQVPEGAVGLARDTGGLDSGPLLLAEFTYAAATAAQAHEDRARVSTFYVVTVGSLVAANITSQLGGTQAAAANWLFAILFGTLALAGFSTLLQLARLRQAWRESALAMCEIKEHYAKHGLPGDSVMALRWTRDSLPPAFKPWSVSYLLALQVALLSSVSLGTAVVIGVQALGLAWWGLPPALGVGFLVIQLLSYRALLLRGETAVAND